MGTVQYTPWCNDDGKVVSDGLVFRASDSSYRFTGDPTCDWFTEKAEGYDVEVLDEPPLGAEAQSPGSPSRSAMSSRTCRSATDPTFVPVASTTRSTLTVVGRCA